MERETRGGDRSEGRRGLTQVKTTAPTGAAGHAVDMRLGSQADGSNRDGNVEAHVL